MNSSLKFIHVLIVAVFCAANLLPWSHVAAESAPSVFRSFELKYGITIKIPAHWEIINSSLMRQIDTNTELQTGTPQGNNDIIIAANYYDGKPGGAAATARISVRIKKTMTQTEVGALSQEDLDAINEVGYQTAVSALQKSGDTDTTFTKYRTVKDTLANLLAMRTDYQEINKGRVRSVSIYVICLGDRSVKVTLSHDPSQERILKSTINEIKTSIKIPK